MTDKIDTIRSLIDDIDAMRGKIRDAGLSTDTRLGANAALYSVRVALMYARDTNDHAATHTHTETTHDDIRSRAHAAGVARWRVGASCSAA